MIFRSSAFGRDQIDPTIPDKQVRPLDPHRIGLRVDAAVDQHRARTDGLEGGIDLLQPDGAMAGVIGHARWRPVIYDPARAIGRKEQRRIDRVIDPFQPDGVGPRARRICCGDDEIAATIDAGVDDKEFAVVVAERRSKQPARHFELGEIDLVWPVDGVADLPPVNEVAAVEDRQAGKIGKSRGDEVIIVADAEHAGVRVEARQHRVSKFAGLRDGPVDVAPTIVEPVKARGSERQAGDNRDHWVRILTRVERSRSFMRSSSGPSIPLALAGKCAAGSPLAP